MSLKTNTLETGQLYTAFLRYQNDDGTFLPDNQGKPRPVLLIQDPVDKKFYLHKVTGQVHKSLNKKYGYEVEDWKEAGLKSPSIVKCNIDNRFEIESNTLRKCFGKLSENDLIGFTSKLVKVRRLEQQNNHELDR